MKTLISVLVGLALLMPACNSDEKAVEARPAGPLHFDPTERYELAQWWTNGDELVNLRPNYTYAVYVGNNRYTEPIQRGRWAQLTYAALQLEPYSLNAGVERVAIDKDSNGELVMIIPGLKAMAPVDGPPQVLEDWLIGEWVGGEFSVDLLPNMQYEFQRRRNVPVGEAALGAHTGRWKLVDDSVVLQPDAPGIKPILLKTTTRDNSIVIVDLERR